MNVTCATETCTHPAVCTAPDGLPCCRYCAEGWQADGHSVTYRTEDAQGEETEHDIHRRAAHPLAGR